MRVRDSKFRLPFTVQSADSLLRRRGYFQRQLLPLWRAERESLVALTRPAGEDRLATCCRSRSCYRHGGGEAIGGGRRSRTRLHLPPLALSMLDVLCRALQLEHILCYGFEEVELLWLSSGICVELACLIINNVTVAYQVSAESLLSPRASQQMPYPRVPARRRREERGP
jgi:hypothetical protein